MALKSGSPLRRPRYTSGTNRCAICDAVVIASEECFDPRRTARSRKIVHEKCALFVMGMRKGKPHFEDPAPSSQFIQLTLWVEKNALTDDPSGETKGKR